jgi:hypothetical protein
MTFDTPENECPRTAENDARAEADLHANFTAPSACIDEIRGAIDILHEPDAIVELRAIFSKGRKRTDAGYFDREHRQELAQHAARLNREGAAVYVNLNPIDPQLLSRYANRIQQHAPATATDKDIIHRRWLLLDFDPKRPKDTAATDTQFEAAKSVARECFRYLISLGWPNPLTAESGNGMHLLYPIDLPNDPESTGLLQAVLNGLGDRLDNDVVSLDRTVFNAGRITKLYGTVANKGDHGLAAPWRLSRLLTTQRSGIVRVKQLQAVAAKLKEKPKTDHQSMGAFDLADFLVRLGIGYTQDRHGDRDRYKLDQCPFNAEHGKGEAAVFRAVDGTLGFKCLHNGCATHTWRDLRELVDGPREQRNRGESNRQAKDQEYSASTRVELMNGGSIRPEPVRWVWDGWLAKGKFHVLAGPPGTGKTTIAAAMAATITCGGTWPDASRSALGNVLIWSGEDDPSDTLVPRLLACGANTSRVWFVGDVQDGQEPQTFDPAVHMSALEATVDEIGGIDLLIVDPIVSAVAGDSHKNAEVRRGLQPLVTLATKLDCAVLGISHFTKGTAGRDPVERVTGSIAFGALARVVMAAAKMPDGDHQGGSRIFCRTKSNIGPDDGGYRYDLKLVELKDHPGVMASGLLWGKAETGSSRDLLNRAENLADGEGGHGEESAQVNWLREFLAYGAKSSDECKAEGKKAGFSEKQLRTAREKLRIIPVRKGFGKDGVWMWSLPAGTFSTDKDAHAQQDGHSTNSGASKAPLTEATDDAGYSDSLEGHLWGDRASMDDGLNGQPHHEAASMSETSPGATSSGLEMEDSGIDALVAHAASVWNDAGINDDVEWF